MSSVYNYLNQAAIINSIRKTANTSAVKVTETPKPEADINIKKDKVSFSEEAKSMANTISANNKENVGSTIIKEVFSKK